MMRLGPCISIITKNSRNPAYEGARIGVDRTLSQYGAKSIHYVPMEPDDIGEQSQLIQCAINDKPDAILLAPAHETLMLAAIKKVIKSRIPLFCFVSNPVPSPSITFVGSDNFGLAHSMAVYLATHLKGRGEIVIVNGHPNAATTGPRAEGFREGLKAFPKIAIGDEIEGDYQREIAASAFDKVVRRKGLPDGVLAANDFMACGVWDILRKRGANLPLVGANATPDGISLIKEGAMLASAAFDAMSMASLAAESAIRYLQGKHVPSNIELPVKMIDRNSITLWDKPYMERECYTWEQAMELGRVWYPPSSSCRI